MKKFSVALLALTAVLAFSPLALATPIPIAAGSTIVVNGSNASWIIGTSVTFNIPTGDASVAAGTNGSFTTAGVVRNNDVVINSPTINFATPGEMVFTTYNSTNGTDIGTSPSATFTIFSPVNISTDNGQYLTFSGTGVMTLTGYLPTLVTYTFSDNDNSLHNGQDGESVYGFTINSTGIFAPEPGSLTLFGTGLLGLAGLLRFKFKKS